MLDCDCASMSQHFRYESKVDLMAPKRDFRYAPGSGIKSDVPPCPFGANTGLMHRSKPHR
jgi:hypothetical protein